MAASKANARSESSIYASLRAQVTTHLDALAIEQERLREVLRLMSAGQNGRVKVASAPLVPEPIETLPAPRRRTWSPAAREAQRKRMKAHWRKQKAASKR